MKIRAKMGKLAATSAAVAAALILIIAILAIPQPAYANSALRYLNGADATGAILRGENHISVQKEKLSFDLREFPKNYYESNDDFFAYSGSVSAEYTFVNNADTAVTATLCFPFGKLPQYAPDYPYAYEGELPAGYSVSVRGEEIETKIRHTFLDPYSDFDVERDLALIVDGYLEDDFYAPDLPVVKLVYTIENVDNSNWNSQKAAFEIQNKDGNARIILENMSCLRRVGDKMWRVGAQAYAGDKITMYALGESDASACTPNWTFYADGGLDDGNEINGKMSEPDISVCTLEEFALEGWEESSGVSKTDWYNAVVAQLTARRGRDMCPAVSLYALGDTLTKNLMRWFEYDISFAPGESVTNRVTAPIYPTIDEDYEPMVFFYTYLLSPAKTWESFGELEITINTPYYLVNSAPYYIANSSSLPREFEKTDGGYSVTLDGLPDGELTFGLSTSADPVRKKASFGDVLLSIILMLASTLLAPLMIFGYGFSGVVALLILGALVIKPAIDILGCIVVGIVFAAKSANGKRKAAQASAPAPQGEDRPSETEAQVEAPPSDAESQSVAPSEAENTSEAPPLNDDLQAEALPSEADMQGEEHPVESAAQSEEQRAEADDRK